MSWLPHLPTTSQADVTENFEQLQAVLEELKARIAALESKVKK